MERKLFTVSEANAMLPQLKEDLRELQSLVKTFRQRQFELEIRKSERHWSPDEAAGKPDPFFEEESRLEFMRVEIDLMLGNFERKGVLLKMISPGLIDFPAIVDGKIALICWKEGEDKIGHYHGWHEGFMGRKPLPDA